MNIAVHISETKIETFFLDLANGAEAIGNEDWQAGGAFTEILLDLKREGHISDELYIAGSRLAHDMTRVHGSSAGLTARYGKDVDGGGKGDRIPRFSGDVDAFNRMNSVLSALRDHERAALTFCILSRELARGSLGDYGRNHSAYEASKTAKAFATGQIKSLLQSIAEIYRSRVPIGN